MIYQAGEIVRLKTGGSTMTVESADTMNVTCVWLVGSTDHRETFTADLIESIDPKYQAGFIPHL